MKDILSLLGNLQDMQSHFESLHLKMDDVSIDGVSGGGMVKVTLDGKGLITNIFIDPDLMKKGEQEILADLILTAHNNARVQLDEKVREKTLEMSTKLPDILADMKSKL